MLAPNTHPKSAWDANRRQGGRRGSNAGHGTQSLQDLAGAKCLGAVRPLRAVIPMAQRRPCAPQCEGSANGPRDHAFLKLCTVETNMQPKRVEKWRQPLKQWPGQLSTLLMALFRPLLKLAGPLSDVDCSRSCPGHRRTLIDHILIAPNACSRVFLCALVLPLLSDFSRHLPWNKGRPPQVALLFAASPGAIFGSSANLKSSPRAAAEADGGH